MTTLDRAVIQEVNFEEFWTPEYIAELDCTLPKIRADDPAYPEWPETPVIELDLAKYGYDAKVYIKDESQNPTGTIKDRRSLENGPMRFRETINVLQSQNLNGNIQRLRMPRFSELTAGNAGIAQAVMNAKYNLPPPKLLLDKNTPEKTQAFLKTLRADIYLADLKINTFTGKSTPYTPLQVKILTNNPHGHSISD
ncbi:PLP-dependent lyase/thiolase [Candidatus Woesearchaeota archaeon]|nr:PLP-dependent lyase/thiolase [Candidatus Woesearchaeota archaeon]